MENAIYADQRLDDVAVVSVPDRRLGELVAAVVHPKAAFIGKVREEEIIAIAQKSYVFYLACQICADCSSGCLRTLYRSLCTFAIGR